jgi:hypothetical protein
MYCIPKTHKIPEHKTMYSLENKGWFLIGDTSQANRDYIRRCAPRDGTAGDPAGSLGDKESRADDSQLQRGEGDRATARVAPTGPLESLIG